MNLSLSIHSLYRERNNFQWLGKRISFFCPLGSVTSNYFRLRLYLEVLSDLEFEEEGAAPAFTAQFKLFQLFSHQEKSLTKKNTEKKQVRMRI